jgi:hypothetical protein
VEVTSHHWSASLYNEKGESTELVPLIDRIRARKRGFKVYNTRLVVNERGRAKATTNKEESTGNIRAAQTRWATVR